VNLQPVSLAELQAVEGGDNHLNFWKDVGAGAAVGAGVGACFGGAGAGVGGAIGAVVGAVTHFFAFE
jgi:hypothetical protein